MYGACKHGITQFYLPPTSGMSHTCLYFPAAELHTPWPVLISRPAEGRRLSWQVAGYWLYFC